MIRLSNQTLAAVPPGIATPSYDRSALGNGIVHLGLGAFHRGHQAAYTDAVLTAGDLRWGIAAASLRSAETRDALAPQDGLYALEVRGESDRIAIIGAVTRILVAPENPAALLAAMAAPSTAIVSLTVTEKAYCRAPASGDLDTTHLDIRHDLERPDSPRSALGLIAAAVARRRADGLAPFTVLCCDNLSSNGQTVHRLLGQFAGLRDPDLAAFIDGEIACPDTMVDRIVPATTDADRARIAAALGMQDAWPVVTEPFTQWVVEDRFPADRPEWELAGATMVGDVGPFEAMKLRMLNASHSALAYLGYLAGAETVADAMRLPSLADFARRVMEDAAVTLPPGLDTATYAHTLLARFRNPALRHRTWQIAMDGSEKLPQRVLATLEERLRSGLPIDTHAMIVAAWIRYVGGIDEAGHSIDVRDPLSDELSRIAADAGPSPERQAPAFLAIGRIFGDLGRDERMRSAVLRSLDRLHAAGAARACQPF